MSFSLKTRKVGEVVLLDMSGRLMSGEPVQSLRTAVRQAVDEGSRKFIFNLGDVSHIDSSGLGELITSYTTIRGRGGDVKLLKLTKRAKDLLQMTKLLTVFECFDDEQLAQKSMG
jgi:anti-sigma B factor antagonist